MIEGRLTQLPDICQSFPEPLAAPVPRDNLLASIESMFEAGALVVVMEGQEGIGNTTLLAQWSERHPRHSISLFVRLTNSLLYNLQNLRFDLCNQMNWILHGEELEAPEEVDDVLRGKLAFQLAQHARRTRQHFTFVVDGLTEMPDSDAQFRNQILGLLPWGESRLRILLSGDIERLAIPKGIPLKVSSGVPFLPVETVNFFGPNVDPEVAQEAHRLCNGVPGQLALLKNLFATEGDPRLILSQAPKALRGLFEFSWRQIESVAEEDRALLLDILALMAHGRRTHTVSELARVVGTSASKAQEMLTRLSFVSVGAESSAQISGADQSLGVEEVEADEREVRFLSEGFRHFAGEKLAHLKKKANDLHIEDLLRHPDNPESLSDLPIYYRQAGRFEDLLGYLDSDNLSKLLDRTRSLAIVQSTADEGLMAARMLGRDREMMQLSIQKSALSELENAQSWRSEAEARMALRDYDAAFALAQSAVLHEDRLHLLAIIAGSKCKQGLEVEPELSEQIEQLCQQINPPAMRARAMEIACDLVLSHPALAISLVESANTSETGENALDWAFAHLSLEAVRQRDLRAGQDEQESRLETSLEGITNRIQDPEARRFSNVMSQFYGYGRFSGARIIEEARKLPDVGAQIYMLRHWALGNSEHPDSAEVINTALRLLVDVGAYVPTMRDLRDLAVPLPFIGDEEIARELVGRFDVLRGAIEWAATEDAVAVQLLLAQAEMKFNPEAVGYRIEEIYYAITDLEDLSVKTACFARVVAMLDEIDPTHIFETQRDSKTHTSARSELNFAFDALLEATADHHEATRGVVRALARTQPELALALIEKLNTVLRRDQALGEFVDAAARVPASRLDLRSIETALKRFYDPDARDHALVEVIKRLDSVVEGVVQDGGVFPFDKASPLLDRVEAVAHLEGRCIACCFALSMLGRAGREADGARRQKLEATLDDAWASLDPAWLRIDVGFKIAAALSGQASGLARSYIAKTEEARQALALDNDVCARSHLSCLLLAIRAYAGLLPRAVDSADDLERLLAVIEEVPSQLECIRLYTDLALRCELQGRHEACRKIVNERLSVLLNNLGSLKNEYQDHMVVFAAPALYCAHKATALSRISPLPEHLRDDAYAAICQFLLKKKSPFDPFDALPHHAYAIDFEDALDICELLDLIDYDSCVYHHIACIVDSATSTQRTLITGPQKADLAERLEKIAAAKFPSQRHIRHRGYVVAAKAQVARLRRSKKPVWDALLQDARAIPNLADRAFVLGIVAVAMRNLNFAMSEVTAVFEEVATVVEQIPVLLDRMEHYETLARMAGEVDRIAGSKYSTLVIEMASEINNPASMHIQQRVIDSWHRIDPAIASSLAAKADSDPARENLKDRLEMLDLRSRMANEQLVAEDVDASQREHCINAAWMILGQMNAERVNPCHRDYARRYVEVAAGGSMKDAYRIMAWVIQNTVRRHCKTDQAREFLRPVFEAMLQGAALSIKMAARNSQNIERARRNAVGSSDTVLVIDAGERGKALGIIEDWLRSLPTNMIKLCDPYLDPGDVCQVLQLIREVNPGLSVQILTSFEGLSAEQARSPKESYVSQWRRTYDQDPPETQVVIVGTRSSSKSPFHDRWWIAEGSGLSTGTSFNGYGSSLHNFVRLSADEAQENEDKLNAYLQMRKLQHKGERLRYEAFTLDL